METTSKLPDKPSELIELALGDLEKCERDPRYLIDMGTYFDERGDKCLVCLAGGVMAQRLPRTATRKGHSSPSDFHDGDIRHKLWFLSSLATGDPMESALTELDEECPEELIEKAARPYSLSPELFKADMRQLAAELKEHGL